MEDKYYYIDGKGNITEREWNQIKDIVGIAHETTKN